MNKCTTLYLCKVLRYFTVDLAIGCELVMIR